MKVRPEGYETPREYRARKVREVRAATQRNNEWGFAVLAALADALAAAGNPGARPVELVRPKLRPGRGYRAVGVSSGWPIVVHSADPFEGARPKRVTLLTDSLWAPGGWDRDERCLRVLRHTVRPIGQPFSPAAFDDALVASVEALELAHGFRITFPDV